MPTTYAHHHFGSMVLDLMEDKFSSIILAHRDFFEIGVHGPDIFFYYDPFQKNDINEYGNHLHDIGARQFFENSRTVYRSFPEKEEMLSYLCGFLSHFVFDSMAHGYVEKKKEESGISHNLIESQLDGHLIKKDGFDPISFDRSAFFDAKKQICDIIDRFFEYPASYQSVKNQKFFLKLLRAPNHFSQKFKLGILRRYPSLRDLVVREDTVLPCLDSNLRLEKIEVKAGILFSKLFKNYYDYLNGEGELDPYFDNTFSFDESYRDILVLTYNEEQNYLL